VTGICICCGRFRVVQRHHPGRRECTAITVPACQECHTILTIWDGGLTGERHWEAGTPDVIRVNAGVTDILKLMCLRVAWFDMADETDQIIREFSPLFAIRYSASDTAHVISEVTPDDLEQQINEIRTMMRSYQACLRT
jgi:hypothetical protein